MQAPSALAHRISAPPLCSASTEIPPQRPQITVPRTASGRIAFAEVHHVTIGRLDRASVGVIPCTGPARMLCDCATILGRDELATIVDETFHRRRTTPAKVRAALGRPAASPGRRGEGMLRELLVAWDGAIMHDSPAEARMLRRLREWGFPDPERQHEVAPNGLFVARLDLAWPDLLIGLEYDGDRWHNPRFYERDEGRHSSLERRGWWIGRASKVDLLPSATGLRDELASVFAARGAPGGRASRGRADGR